MLISCIDSDRLVIAFSTGDWNLERTSPGLTVAGKTSRAPNCDACGQFRLWMLAHATRLAKEKNTAEVESFIVLSMKMVKS